MINQANEETVYVMTVTNINEQGNPFGHIWHEIVHQRIETDEGNGEPIWKETNGKENIKDAQAFAEDEINYWNNHLDEGETKRKVINVFLAEESLFPLVGLSDAAKIIGWDRRRVQTYLQRGKFPEPIQRISSGPVWTYKQIEAYKAGLDNG